MLHSSTKPLLWGGLGAWRCLATDWELCGCAENKESGNTSCIKMQHPGLGDLSLAAGAETPWLLCSCTAARKDRTCKGCTQTPTLGSTYVLVSLQCSSQNHPHTSPEHQEATEEGKGGGQGAATLTAGSLPSHHSTFSKGDTKQLSGLTHPPTPSEKQNLHLLQLKPPGKGALQQPAAPLQGSWQFNEPCAAPQHVTEGLFWRNTFSFGF